MRDDSMPKDPALFDISIWFNNPENIFIKVTTDEGELGGVFILKKISNISYEIHTNLLSNCRGSKAKEAGDLLLEWLFTKTDCIRATTVIPDNNIPAKHLAENCGMRLEYTRQYAFVQETIEYGLNYYAISIHDYIWRHADKYEAYGKQFHEGVDKVHELLGSDPHPEDESHNAMVGFCFFTLLNGDHLKAFLLYNEWATSSGYQPLNYVVKTYDNDIALDQDGLSIIIDNEGNIYPMEEY